MKTLLHKLRQFATLVLMAACPFSTASAAEFQETFIAYEVPAKTRGTQAFDGAVGMHFAVDKEIVVTRLGVFDEDSNGLRRPLKAKLYNRTSRSLLAALDFRSDDPGELVGGSRFKRLDAPIRLGRGFEGTIVAEGYGAQERLNNSSGVLSNVVWTVNSGSGAIRFVGASSFGTAGSYPTTNDRGPAARYAAGTFEFEIYDPSDPSAPNLTVASPTQTSTLTLEWSPISAPVAAARYLIFRAADSAGPFRQIGETVETTYVDSGLDHGTRYCYGVRAVSSAGNISLLSTPVCATSLPDSSSTNEVPQAQNLAINPGFETGTSTGWSSFGPTSIVVQTNQVRSGKFAVRVSNRTAIWNGVRQVMLNTLQAGSTYKFSAWIRLDGGTSETGKLTLRKQDASGTTFPSLVLGPVRADRWSQLSGQYTLSYSGRLEDLTFYIEINSNPNVSFFADDITVELIRAGSPGTTELPSAPTLALGTVDNSSVKLTWPIVGNPLPAVKYVVSRAATSSGPFSKIGETLGAMYQDVDLTASTPYCYVVSAVAANGRSSANSAPICTTTKAAPDTGIRGDTQDSEFQHGKGVGGVEPFVAAITLQNDGKILIGGKFQGFQGAARTNLARLSPDGSIDASFSEAARVDGIVWDIGVQADRSIVVGGQFTRAHTNRSSRLARFFSDGTIDARFAAAGGANEMVGSVLPMQDAETGENFLVIGGAFTAVQGKTRSRLAFLNPDGSLRETATVPSVDGQVYDLAEDLQGRILIGGAFSRRLLRLNPDGRWDAFFEASINGPVWTVAVQRDGKILVGGEFTVVEARSRRGLARLNADGSLDESFNPQGGFSIPGSPTAAVLSLAVQGDGRIDAAGAFVLVDGRRRFGIARLEADGRLDLGFNPVVDGIVYKTAVQPDGKVLLGGDFQSLNGQPVSALTRLFGDPPVPVPSTLEKARRFLGSRIAFNVGGKPQQVYTIQTSTNLAVWESQRVVTNTTGLHLFSTPMSQDAGPRFFRAVEGHINTIESIRSRRIATGVDHDLAIASDGTLWAWGSNSEGRAGLGGAERADKPTRIHEKRDWKSVSVGSAHSAAIDGDGILWTWGKGDQNGSGGTTDIRTPMMLPGDWRWREVDCGDGHTVAIRSDGSLWAWGKNLSGQLGVGTLETRLMPTAVESDRSWRTVSAGSAHTGAIATDGTLWCWGSNEWGQAGTGTFGERWLKPQQVGTETNWAWVSAGGSHTVAGKSDGSLWGFGGNQSGQVGVGTTQNVAAASRIGGAKNWVAAACGVWHTLGIRSDGSLWVWGDNAFGQLGISGNQIRLEPTRMGVGQDWLGVSAGILSSLAIGRDGNLVELRFSPRPIEGVWAIDPLP